MPLDTICSTGTAAPAGVPPHCVPVILDNVSLTLKNGADALRRGIPLAGGYAVTDFFAQGMSFGDACWLVDLRPPSTGPFLRATILVMISRFANMTKLQLLAPLWDSPTHRTEVIARFHEALKPDPDLVRAIQRLHHIAQATKQRHSNQ